MSPAEWTLWTVRLLDCIGAFIRFWRAVEASDEGETEEAKLAMVRAVKDAQAKERIG